MTDGSQSLLLYPRLGAFRSILEPNLHLVATQCDALQGYTYRE